MVREKPLAVQLLGAVIVLGMTLFNSAAHAEPFDKPLQEKVVDFGPSPELGPNRMHVKLTCSYYPTFMVKELNDPGHKGALWIAIVPARTGNTSGCTRRHGPGEKVFPRDWDEYFGGVKRDLVFIYAADCLSEELGFRAFDSKTGAKLFEDSVWLLHRELDFANASDGQMTLKYLRVVTGPCSVPKDGIACWNRFEEQLALRLAPMPKCSTYQGLVWETPPSLPTRWKFHYSRNLRSQLLLARSSAGQVNDAQNRQIRLA
jgi:hypothetical protein